jgi:thiosulfate dehydrogenase (quinone) large subunit
MPMDVRGQDLRPLCQVSPTARIEVDTSESADWVTNTEHTLMASQHALHPSTRFHRSTDQDAASAAATRIGARTAAIAVVRIGTGFLFLWAFLDKMFGLGYSTPSSKAWIHGGSPTKGFLGSVAVGPLQSTFHSMAGTAWADWLFMLALLGVGVALILGIGLRAAAVAGIALVALMWLAVYPPAQHTATGVLTASTNPFVDEHAMDAFALLAVAAFGAASPLGLGATWARIPFVKRHHRALL